MSSRFLPYIKSAGADNYTFSVLIPSYNNLPLLQVLIRSLKTHSSFRHQIIVIVNEGKDGTLEWLKSQEDIDAIHCPENSGVCLALNYARSFVKTDYIVYLNDDMYVLPEWDKVFHDEIQRIGHKYFFLSGTMIEHTDTNNPCVVVKDYGNDVTNFREEALLSEYKALNKSDWFGATWPPNILHRELWDLVGGYSIEFSPGLYSDPDLSLKLWMVGVRDFRGLGKSLVYHFGSKTTGRVKLNKGALLFFLKWGMTSGTFTSKVLRRGEPYTAGEKLTDSISVSGLKMLWKKLQAALKFKGAFYDDFWKRYK